MIDQKPKRAYKKRQTKNVLAEINFRVGLFTIGLAVSV
jgi:hypothetical protein